ncbi:MAG: DUF4288 domain-containing protein [Candidatus Methylacidiphilales bacterium]
MVFLAKLVFSITSANNSFHYDDQLRVVFANNKHEALMKAKILGIKDEENFMLESLTSVSWKFIDVMEITALEDLKDGMEIYSHTRENEPDNSYENYVSSAANNLIAETILV